MSGKDERDPWGSRVGACVFSSLQGAIFIGWVGGVPHVLVSRIRVGNRFLTYSKEIPYLPLRLRNNMMLLEAHDHGYSR